MLKKLGGIAAVALCVFLTSFMSAEAKEHVRVGIEGAFPPWNLMDAQGKLSGLDADLIKVLCKRADLDCELVTGPWKGMVPGLQAGKYDAIMTVGINEKRKKVIDFTTPYASGVASFLILKKGPVGEMPMTGKHLDLNDKKTADPVMKTIGGMLKGKTVGVVQSTSQETLIKAYFGDDVTVRSYDSSPDRDLDLRAGRIDVGFDSGVYETSMLAKTGNDDMEMTGPLMRGAMLATNVAIGIQKGNTALKAKFDKAIRSAAEDGTIRKLSLKWSKLDLTPKAAD